MLLEVEKNLAKLVKPDCLATAQSNWAIIKRELIDQGISDPNSFVAVAATVAVETARTFKPIEEMGNKAYFIQHYWDNREIRAELGNLSPEDAYKFNGHGYIQLTGRHNYEQFQKASGLPVVDDPNLLLLPSPSAKALVWFWKTHGLDRLASQSLWGDIRRRVNGGNHGLVEFYGFLKSLGVTVGLPAH